jgi:phosphatidylglycerophosphate synthase
MEPEGRRPLKTRSAGWARAVAGWLNRRGVAPNAISAASVAMAALGGLAFLAAAHGRLPWGAGWVAGAICIQLRLLCNLFDGMVAIEGGRKTPTGDLWNEIPDRLADTLLLVCAGFAAGVPWIGVLAAWGAVMTAYLRAVGAALTGKQDFSGPFAKPQRMAVLTAAALLTALEPLWNAEAWILKAALVVIAAGTLSTVIRRNVRLAATLRAR